MPADVAYGKKPAAGGGCDLGTWAIPNGCILPAPYPVVIQLNQWERWSANLTGHVNPRAKQAFK